MCVGSTTCTGPRTQWVTVISCIGRGPGRSCTTTSSPASRAAASNLGPAASQQRDTQQHQGVNKLLSATIRSVVHHADRPVQTGYPLRRGGGQHRWHSLVNCNHGDSSSSRLRLTIGCLGALRMHWLHEQRERGGRSERRRGVSACAACAAVAAVAATLSAAVAPQYF
jgi:hypothetical protein